MLPIHCHAYGESAWAGSWAQRHMKRETSVLTTEPTFHTLEHDVQLERI